MRVEVYFFIYCDMSWTLNHQLIRSNFQWLSNGTNKLFQKLKPTFKLCKCALGPTPDSNKSLVVPTVPAVSMTSLVAFTKVFLPPWLITTPSVFLPLNTICRDFLILCYWCLGIDPRYVTFHWIVLILLNQHINLKSIYFIFIIFFIYLYFFQQSKLPGTEKQLYFVYPNQPFPPWHRWALGGCRSSWSVWGMPCRYSSAPRSWWLLVLAPSLWLFVQICLIYLFVNSFIKYQFK